MYETLIGGQLCWRVCIVHWITKLIIIKTIFESACRYYIIGCGTECLKVTINFFHSILYIKKLHITYDITNIDRR